MNASVEIENLRKVFILQSGWGRSRVVKQAVAVDQKRVRPGRFRQRGPHTTRQPSHVLIIRDDRHPFALRVRRHSVEAFQHLEAFDGKPAAIGVES